MATQKKIAEHLFLSTRRVRQLQERDIIAKGSSLESARKAYIQYLRSIGPGEVGKDGSNYADERARETRERADNLALKNAQLRRELLPAEVVSHVLAKVCNQIAATLDTIPTVVKRKLPKMTQTELEIIKREIVKCQNAAARSPVYLDEWLDDLERESA